MGSGPVFQSPVLNSPGSYVYWLAVFRSNCESPVRIPITVQVLERPRSEDFLVDFSPNYCIGDSIEINPRINPASQKFEEFSAFKWYFDPNGISPVPLGQPSPNSHGFFVSQGKLVNQNAELGEYVFYISAVSDSNCETFPSQFRKVNFKINPRPEDPIFNSNSLELCEEDLPKVSDLNLIFGKGLVWYDEKIGDSALPLDHLLENGREYKAKAINESACLSIGVDYVRITTIECKPKLFLHKKALNFNPIAGDTLSYSIRVENRGIRTAYDLQVTDSLPMGTVVESTFPSGEVGPGVVVWSLDSLSGGESVEYEVLLKVSGDVSGGTVLVNRSYLSGSEVPGGVLESESEEVEVLSESALTLSKELEGSGSGYVGEEFGYRIVLKNGGPSTSYGLTLRDTLPSFMEYVSSTGGGQYEGSSGVVSWSVDRLGSGDSLVYELRVRGVSESSGFTNRVGVYDVSGKELKKAESGQKRLERKVPVLNMEKKVSVGEGESVVAGTEVGYRIRVWNTGLGTAYDLQVTDSLPMGTVVESTFPSGEVGPGVVVWSLDSLAGGESVEYEVLLKVSGDVSGGTVLVNRSYLSGSEVPGGVLESESEEVEVLSESALTLSKELEGSGSGYVGEEFGYRIVLKNGGPSTSYGLTLRDTLPSFMEYVSSTGVGQYEGSSGVVSWSVDRLGSGDSLVYELKVRGVSESSGFTNRVVVLDSGLKIKNEAQARELRITKKESKFLFNKKFIQAEDFENGDTINYLIEIKNISDFEIDSIYVIDSLSNNFKFLRSNYPVKLDDKNVLRWDKINLQKGESLTISFDVKIQGILGEEGFPIRNTAYLINPIDPKIWVSSIDLWVGKVRRPKISINKELENKSFNVGEIAKYKVVISNSGDSLASNLVFRDFVPEQLEFLSLNESFEFKIENGYVDIYIPKIEIAESIELNLNFLIKEYHNNIINRGELIHTGFDTLYVESDPVVFKLIDLNIEKSVEAPVIKLFEEFNYRLRITNKLKDLATNVLVIDTLPKEVQFIKFLDHKGLASYDPFSNSITWRIPSLGLGETLDLLVEVNALEVADGIKNTAFVEGNEMDVDLNNNSSTVYHKQMRIKIPNVFTPNNDGYNDRFEIEGIEALAQNELIVVNRWGIIIYRSKDYQNDWNGGILNEGAYYYVLTWRDRTGNLEELKGYVTIIRN